MNIQEAAKLYMYPMTAAGNLSPVYADHYFRVDQEKRYGKEAWENACRKARTEYNFGSSAVRW